MVNLEKRFTLPWYRDGLPFSCTQCGKCCSGSPGFVWITEEEIVKMADFLKITLSIFKRMYTRRIGHRFALIEKKTQNHSCVFYKDKQCMVYLARPLQCKTYPFWQENLSSEESWKQAAKDCEGIHPEAFRIPHEKIEELLEAQRKQSPEEHFVPSEDAH